MGPAELILTLLMAILIVVLLRFGGNRGKKANETRMIKKYANLDRGTFDSIPEGEYTDAVVSHLFSHLEEAKNPDPIRELGELEHGYTVAYSVWVICKEMASGDFTSLMATPSREAVDLAQDGFDAIGAPGCKAALAALKEAYNRLGEETVAAEEAYAAAEEAFRQAISEEMPLGLCDEYVRDHADEFIEEEEQ